MDFIEVTGKSVDAAVFNGLQQLGVSIDEVKIETLQTETKGILGIGAKPAKVRLTIKAPEEIVLPDFETESRQLSSERGERRRHSDRKFRHEDRKRGNGRRYSERPREDYSENPTGEKAGEKAQSFSGSAENAERTVTDTENEITASETESSVMNGYRPENAVNTENTENAENTDGETEEFRPAEKINYTEEAALNNPAAEFVSGLAARMGVEAKVLAFTDEKNIKLRINGEQMHVLIGHRGETLDAIQYLTSLVVNRNRKENGYKRITVDTNDYREKREATLIRLAKRIGEQVRATGRPRALEPMNPYERRILHSALQSSPYVTTHSEGEEPNRRVVVTPLKRR